jgi:hypothetical protein
MDEHDDDLESTVHEQAEIETDTYPTTGDELDDENGEAGENDDPLDLDDDPAEL